MPCPELLILSLHDALPISLAVQAFQLDRDARAGHVVFAVEELGRAGAGVEVVQATARDRKSTRLNSSHLVISYAVFCLKKKKETDIEDSQYVIKKMVVKMW